MRISHEGEDRVARLRLQNICLNDDWIDYKNFIVAVPDPFTVKEQKGGVSWKEVMSTTYLGVEMGIRMALAITPKSTHPFSPFLCGFASEAAAIKIPGLSAEQILGVLSIAYYQVSPIGGGITSSSFTKSLRPGLAVKSVFFLHGDKHGFNPEQK
ncbi:MAG: hypothetical protein WCO26_01680 [Deltaproteobacteria bacterium]